MLSPAPPTILIIQTHWHQLSVGDEVSIVSDNTLHDAAGHTGHAGHHGQLLPPPPGAGPDPVLLRVRGGGVQGPGGGGGPGGQGGQLDPGEDGHIRQHTGDTLRSVQRGL